MDQNTSNRQLATGNSRMIEMGVFAAPHGIRGQIKLRSYTEIPQDITRYGKLTDAQGHSYTITITGEAGDMLIASVEGITDRNDAEKLKNITLFIPRSNLPKPKKGQYYHEDLRNLQIITKDGAAYGTLLSVHDFGAGALVNIALATGGEEYMPFNPQVFPEIDIQAGHAVIDPPFVLQGDKDDA